MAAAAGSGGSHIPVVPRAPLGPYPQPINYPTELSFTPPAGPDLYFYRGNFCGLSIPDAPIVPGCNADHPECVMPALLDNYPVNFQNKYLRAYAETGYTHLQRSIGHSLYYGGSVQSHIELSRRAQGFGLFADEWILGGGEEGSPFRVRDQDAGFWKPFLDPILDPMLAAGAIDHACVGWQLDQFNAPGNPIISIIAYLAEALPAKIPLFTHWMNEALAWWKTGGEIWTDPKYWPGGIFVHDRFSWWFAMQPYLTGGHHQGNTNMARTNPKLYQDKLADTLNPFSGDNSKGVMGQSRRSGIARNFSLTGGEETAQDQFDGICTELEGDGVGYLIMCLNGHNNGHLAGYGNGARLPDGGML